MDEQEVAMLFRKILPLLLIMTAIAVQAAPKKALEPYWVGYDARSAMRVDHSQWQAFLDQYLVTDDSGQTLFNYAGVTEPDLIQLSSYINTLAALDPLKLNRLEQKAYWINMYNALTVQLILRNYPLSTITKLGKKWFGFGPWDDPAAVVNGRNLTLNDIEHRILRPIYNDPRIHYALNCASMGCPNLHRVAYTSANVEVVLENAAMDFVNHPRAVRFSGNRLYLSSIYDWYQNDFGGSESGVLQHIARYADSSVKEKIQQFDGSIKYEYDWSLNEVKQ